MLSAYNAGPALLEKEARSSGRNGVPFYVPTLTGKERGRDEPGGVTGKGRLRRVSLYVYRILFPRPLRHL